MPSRSVIYPGGVEAMLRSPQMVEAMRVRAARVKARAQQISPVDTGLYQRSWHYRAGVRGGKAWARVYNTVHYAGYLEFGTRYMRRRRVLARAMDAIRR
jgi:HK97 gp10 family phage protein